MSDWCWWITKWNNDHIDDLLASIPDDEDVTVINQKETGWSLAHAWNAGLENLANYRTVIISNDDVVVKPETGARLDGILHTAGRATKTLIVSAYDINISEKDFGNVWIPSRLMHPPSFCFAVDERLKQTVGEFDERFFPYLFEDTDMLHRIIIAGYDWATAVPVWHVGGGSTPTAKEVDWRSEVFEINQQRYIEKWGGTPGNERGLNN